jgi:hypothetical protein
MLVRKRGQAVIANYCINFALSLGLHVGEQNHRFEKAIDGGNRL